MIFDHNFVVLKHEKRNGNDTEIQDHHQLKLSKNVDKIAVV